MCLTLISSARLVALDCATLGRPLTVLKIARFNSGTLLLHLALVFLLLPAAAADWPRWRGPEGTGHVPAGVPVPDKLPSEPKFIWRIKIGDGLSSPVVAGGKLFYSDNQDGNETLHSNDAGTGAEFWRTNIDQVFKDYQSPPGPRCTPLVDGDLVYVQSCKGELHCRKVAGGGLIWRVNFNDDFGARFVGEKGSAQGATRHGNNSSPVVDGNVLFVLVGSPSGAGVVAFEKRTGRVLWKSQNDEAAFAAPVVAAVGGMRQLVAFMADGVIGLALDDGRLLWRVPMKTDFGRHVTAPLIFGDLVVVSSHQAGLTGIKVSRTAGNWSAEPAWVKKESAINFACPVAVGDHLYGLGPARNFICVDIRTGAQAWSRDGFISGSTGNAYAGFVVMGRNILSLTDGGQLVMFAAQPGEFRDIGNLQVCGKTWCNPACAGGKLFFRDARELFCLELLP